MFGSMASSFATSKRTSKKQGKISFRQAGDGPDEGKKAEGESRTRKEIMRLAEKLEIHSNFTRQLKTSKNCKSKTFRYDMVAPGGDPYASQR